MSEPVEDENRPLTLGEWREEMHALRGALNRMSLRLETVYLMLCKLMGKEPRP